MTKKGVLLRITALAAALGFAVLLTYPQAAASGVSRGLSVCGEVLIPSLFPFLVLGGVITRSGVAAAVGRRLGPVTAKLFGLPGCCAAVIVISLLGGYPSGGIMVGELVRSGQISHDEGKRLLRFCVNGGPGFVIGTVGAALTGSTVFGVVLWIANLAASLVLGITGVPKGARRRTAAPCAAPHTVSLAQALVASVTGACEALLSMSGFVLLFSAVAAVIGASGLTARLGGTPAGERILSALLASFLEVSGGCTAAAALPENAAAFLGFAVGFGGLAVHCQLAAALRGLSLVDVNFFVARLAQGFMTAVFTLLLLRAVPVTLPVWGALQESVAMGRGSVTVSVALLVLSGVWMLTVGTREKARRQAG